jgi:hypothetical protein
MRAAVHTAPLLFFIAGLLPACSEFIASYDLQSDWNILENDRIILHYRAPGYSASPSPTPEEARRILANQTFYHAAIQDSIHRLFTDRVLIYLFNRDEAEVHIGKAYGGHAIPKYNTFYFSFFHHSRDYMDQYGIEQPFLGAHEIAHVITHRTLGHAGSKLMSEGYANWLDGSYARLHIRDIVRAYRDREPHNILTPTQLLHDTDIADQVYYPNSGVFIEYLVRAFGIERVNLLFNSPPRTLQQDFERHLGMTWQEMERRYLSYITAL